MNFLQGLDKYNAVVRTIVNIILLHKHIIII